jgi:hypothetical protein
MPPVTDDLESARITVKLDDLLYARRMTLTELADRVGLTLAASWNVSRAICWGMQGSSEVVQAHAIG